MECSIVLKYDITLILTLNFIAVQRLNNMLPSNGPGRDGENNKGSHKYK